MKIKQEIEIENVILHGVARERPIVRATLKKDIKEKAVSHFPGVGRSLPVQPGWRAQERSWEGRVAEPDEGHEA